MDRDELFFAIALYGLGGCVVLLLLTILVGLNVAMALGFIEWAIHIIQNISSLLN